MSYLHLRLLQRAVELLGGIDQVGRYLGVSEARVRIWQRGIIDPPEDIFLKLVDLISDGRPPPDPGAPTFPAAKR